MILGLGTDIVEIPRIAAVLERHGDQFMERVFTADETKQADGRIAYFAGRWAAKEAAAKALGCGIGERCAFADIEIVNDDRGRPVMTFSGGAAELAAELGVEEISISISHEASYAVATVILSGRD